jgi:pimeloyl-ACP methyl ester carboxylesterase
VPTGLRRAGIVALVVMVTACARSTRPHSETSLVTLPTPRAMPSSVAAREGPAFAINRRCGSPAARARPIHFRATDGTHLDGALVGHSRVGIVLAHQYRSLLCDWWAPSVHFAHEGIESLIFDFRCAGDSACPEGTKGHVVSDVAGAVARLRADGVRKVFLGGASLGGTTVMIAATRIRPPVAGVLSLSGEVNLGLLLGRPPLNALKAMPALDVPLFIAASRGDTSALPPDMKALYRRAATDDKRLLIEPPSYAHGIAMLTHPGLEWSRVTTAMISFIKAHS